MTGPQIESSVDEGVLVLMVKYDPDVMASKPLSQDLRDRLVAAYSNRGAGVTSAGCVVEINSSVAGSSLIRALFDLWTVVIANSGELRVVNYPSNYTDSLTSLGITTQKGFTLASSREAAVKSLRR